MPNINSNLRYIPGDEYNNLSVFIITELNNVELKIQKKLAKIAITLAKANGVKGKKERINLIDNFQTSSDLLFFLRNSIAFGQANYKKVIGGK